MKGKIEIYIDGACKGNPGEAGIGVLMLEDNETIQEVSRSIGMATNNIAEYSALIAALEEARKHKGQRLKIYTDSELVYKQVTGAYQIKNPNLKILFDQVCDLSQYFERIEIQHIPREKNREADKLASLSLKKKQTKMVAPLFRSSEEESPSSRG